MGFEPWPPGAKSHRLTLIEDIVERRLTLQRMRPATFVEIFDKLSVEAVIDEIRRRLFLFLDDFSRVVDNIVHLLLFDDNLNESHVTLTKSFGQSWIRTHTQSRTQTHLSNAIATWKVKKGKFSEGSQNFWSTGLHPLSIPNLNLPTYLNTGPQLIEGGGGNPRKFKF